MRIHWITKLKKVISEQTPLFRNYFVCGCSFLKIANKVLFSSLLVTVSIPKAMSAGVIPIQVGEWYLEAETDITLGQAFRQRTDGTNTVADPFLSIAPEVNLYNFNKDRDIALRVQAEKTQFLESRESDEEIVNITGEYKKKLTKNSDLTVSTGYEERNNSQGDQGDVKTLSRNSLDSVDYEVKNLLLKYDFYGVNKAGHNFSISAEKRQVKYKGFSEFYERQSETDILNAKWRYLWARDSGVFASVQYSQSDYSSDVTVASEELDNKQTQFLFGLEWRVRENIYGELALGVVDKRFEDTDKNVQVPLFYGRAEIFLTKRDTLNIKAQISSVEPDETDLFQERREVELSWIRRLAPRWNMEAYVANGRVYDELEARKNKFLNYGLLFEYRLSRVSDIILGFRQYENRSSGSDADSSYNASNIFITYSTGL